jgi:lipopolysaccharide transport system permease protein
MRHIINILRFIKLHHQLLRLLFLREIKSRTSGTLLGGAWLLVQPGLQIIGLWFLLDVILKIRYPNLEGGFVAYFLLGMVPWLMMQEIIQRSLAVMNDYASLYQRSSFPLPLLPLVPWMVSGSIYSATIVIMSVFLEGWLSAPAALLFALGLLIWLLPFVYLFAVLGLFLRDLQQVMPFVLTMLLYLTPIFYVPDAFPENLAWWLDINPIAHLMALSHALIQGHAWSWANLWVPGLIWALAIIPAWRLFRRSEPHMREAL